MSKFRSGAGLVVAALLAACGPEEPQRAASDAVMVDVADTGAAWPLLLRHCLSSAVCDPMSDFGTGVGEASGVAGSVSWFFQTKDRVTEGAEDYGARAEVNLFGMRGTRGKAGRPLTIDELPDNLGGAKAKRSTLTFEYRAPSEKLEPYFLQFVSAYITELADGVDSATLEIIGKGGVLYSVEAAGMEAPTTRVNGNHKAPKSMIFHASRNIRDEPVSKLMTAIARGETLSLKLIGPDGGLLLQDVLYTDGYKSALFLAGGAAADPEIARTIPERCARFADREDAFWKIADVTPALLVCDPRLPELRR